MRTEINERHALSENGKPDGGQTTGTGFVIHWQQGPMVVDGKRIPQNGAFVEDIIAAARGRIAFYQSTEFAGEYNAIALVHLESALQALDARTKDRESRGVEGTHEQ